MLFEAAAAVADEVAVADGCAVFVTEVVALADAPVVALVALTAFAALRVAPPWGATTAESR